MQLNVEGGEASYVRIYGAGFAGPVVAGEVQLSNFDQLNLRPVHGTSAFQRDARASKKLREDSAGGIESG